MNIVVSREAQDDIKGIATHVANSFHSVRIGTITKSRIKEAIKRLSDMPYSGFVLDEKYTAPKGLRGLITSRSLIVYKIKGQEILILRVFDTRQDYISKLLR